MEDVIVRERKVGTKGFHRVVERDGTTVVMYSRVSMIPNGLKMAIWDGEIPPSSDDLFVEVPRKSGAARYKIVNTNGQS